MRVKWLLTPTQGMSAPLEDELRHLEPEVAGAVFEVLAWTNTHQDPAELSELVEPSTHLYLIRIVTALGEYGIIYTLLDDSTALALQVVRMTDSENLMLAIQTAGQRQRSLVGDRDLSSGRLKDD